MRCCGGLTDGENSGTKGCGASGLVAARLPIYRGTVVASAFFFGKQRIRRIISSPDKALFRLFFRKTKGLADNPAPSEVKSKMWCKFPPGPKVNAFTLILFGALPRTSPGPEAPDPCIPVSARTRPRRWQGKKALLSFPCKRLIRVALASVARPLRGQRIGLRSNSCYTKAASSNFRFRQKHLFLLLWRNLSPDLLICQDPAKDDQ